MQEAGATSDAPRPTSASAAEARLRGVAMSAVVCVVLVTLTSCVPIGVRVQNMLALAG